MSEVRQDSVLIAGGGVAALEAVLALRASAGRDLPITLICPRDRFEYRPTMVLEPFARVPHTKLDLAEFAAEHDVTLHRDGVVGVRPEQHALRTHSGRWFDYGALLVAVGVRISPGIPGAMTFGSHGDANALRDAMDYLLAGRARTLAFVITSHAGWVLPLYELALLARTQLNVFGVGGAEVTVLTAEQAPLEIFGPEPSDAVFAQLRAAGVRLRTRVKPVAVRDGALLLDGDPAVVADFTFAQPAITGIALDGLPCDQHGLLPVDLHSRVEGLEDVYAAGDITAGMPKQGGLAARQADAAVEMILARRGLIEQPAPWTPSLEASFLTRRELSDLQRRQLSTIGSPEQDDEALDWQLPTKIFAPHLARYLDTVDDEAVQHLTSAGLWV